MKNKQNSSPRSALQITLPIAVISFLAALLTLATATGRNQIEQNQVGVKGLRYPVGIDASWTLTGSLGIARHSHTATLLPSGKVLVAGGYNSGGAALISAELYDPVTGTWMATGSLGTARYQHTATLLPSGKVLVAGGLADRPYHRTYLNSAELYDPAAGTWAAIDSLGTARFEHTATLLPSGKVLVVGGYNSGNLSNAELYDPAAGTWTATGSLGTARRAPTATLLPSGQVLVAGGFNGNPPDASARLSIAPAIFPESFRRHGALSSAELYAPAAGTWTATGSLTNSRYNHTATLLPSGQVLVAGGGGRSFGLSSAELYDPAAGTWTATGSLGTARYNHTATLLPSGQVLVAGGFESASVNSAELYDPAAGTWAATGSLNTARDKHTATLLPSGQVLVAGGALRYEDALSSAELYDEGQGFDSNWRP
jgi:Galactose oxidase, central domain